jgi:hypothetical protein
MGMFLDHRAKEWLALRMKEKRRTRMPHAIAIKVDGIMLPSSGARPPSRNLCGLSMKK